MDILSLRPFDVDRDMTILEELYASWGSGKSCPTEDELPEHGVIIPGLAACFLYQTDSNSCFFEHAITHRHDPERGAGIAACVEALMRKAEYLGYKRVYVNVGNEAAIKRAELCGFVKSELPYRCQLQREVHGGD